MISHAVLVCVGLAVLIYGGERSVEAAVALARGFGLPMTFVGGTLVAVGSSVPEITTALYAGVYGAGDLAVGHIVGSATSQITLGIGIVALLSPLSLEREKVGYYGIGMILAMGLMLLSIRSGTITRLEGAGLVAAYLLFLAVRLRTDDAVGRQVDESALSRTRATGVILFGFALVAVGGHLLVSEGRALAVALGVPEYLLGLVTGLGTTLPEIVIAALAAHRDRSGIAVGTLFGSNVTDPLLSLGAGAVVGEFTLTHVSATVASTGYMIAASTVVVALFLTTGGIGRRAAVACIALYVPTYLL